MKKYWYAMNKDLIKHIEIKTLNKREKQYYLYFPKPNVSFQDAVRPDGFSKDKSITQFQLYPHWGMYYQEHEFKHNNKAIIQYLKDSLRSSHPKITISNSEINYSVKLLGIEYIENNPYQLGSKIDPYWLRMKVKADFRKDTPRHLYGVSMVIKSALLPENRYEYGQCDIFGGFFNKCTTIQYLNSGGGTFNTHYSDPYCQVFDLAKGSSHYKCSVDEGA